jgi:hypothetical protein
MSIPRTLNGTLPAPFALDLAYPVYFLKRTRFGRGSARPYGFSANTATRTQNWPLACSNRRTALSATSPPKAT